MNMINKHELRIGNNLLFSVERKKNPISRFVTVTQIKGNEVVVKDMGFDVVFQYTDENINPIQLSPELLGKCGFVKDDQAGNWNEPDWEIYLFTGFRVGWKNGRCCYYKSAEDDFYSAYWPEITHLHQLQNLYFALTGSEI